MAEDTGVSKPSETKMPLGPTKDYGTGPGYAAGKDKGISESDSGNGTGFSG